MVCNNIKKGEGARSMVSNLQVEPGVSPELQMIFSSKYPLEKMTISEGSTHQILGEIPPQIPDFPSYTLKPPGFSLAEVGSAQVGNTHAFCLLQEAHSDPGIASSMDLRYCIRKEHSLPG